MSMPMLTLTAVLMGMSSTCDSKYVVPPSGPGTDYPCGLQWHACEVPPKTCCPENHYCYADRCRYNPPPMATPDAGRHPDVPRRILP